MQVMADSRYWLSASTKEFTLPPKRRASIGAFGNSGAKICCRPDYDTIRYDIFTYSTHCRSKTWLSLPLDIKIKN